MNDLIQASSKKIEELREKKIAPESIPDALTTALIGPVIARGMIIKELAARGVMKKEANELMGVDRINALSKEYLQRKK